MSLTIKHGARISLTNEETITKVDFKGVLVGKGFAQIGMPTVRLEKDNLAFKILGVPVGPFPMNR